MKLERFVKAQMLDYGMALKEIKAGRKESHWMWYIFPQIKGLGYSQTAQYYAIEDINEAREYLAHPILGSRLREITEALLACGCNDAEKIFGYTDAMKLRSSMTLFYIAGGEALFLKALERLYGGAPDERTVELLGLV